MDSSATLAKARAVKEKVAKIVEGDPSVTGIGIARVGEGYGVKVGVTGPTTAVTGLPPVIDGVPVMVETVGKVTKQDPA